MSSRNYILNSHGIPVVQPDVMEWARWFECCEKRVVKQEKVGDTFVSTVFLGLDHNWSGVGGPVLWETMCFEGKMAGEMDRCSGSREQAEAMHGRMVKRVKEGK